MIIPTTEKKSVVSLLLIGSLFMLTGCLGEKAKDTHQAADEVTTHSSSANKGEVLLSIDGKPVLYADDFEDQKAMAQQSNQQLNMILQMIPDAEFTIIFKSIEAAHLMKASALKHGVDQDAQFVKQMNQAVEAIKLQMYVKWYEEAHPVSVTDHEVENFYKARREQIPGLVVSPVSFDIVYVDFTTKADAEDFAAKSKEGSEKHMKAAAKEAGLKTKSMTVSPNSQVSDILKNTVFSATKFPSKEIVKIEESSYWVVGILKKHDAQYRKLDEPEVKQALTKMCKDEKREIELSKQVEQLITEFNVEENKAYFENKKVNQSKAVANAQQLIMQSQKDQSGQDADFDEEDVMLDDKI